MRIGREGNLVLFAVDASGSMAAGQRMRAVKGAVGSLLRDAYQRRDKVGLITFRGTEATLALPPTSSVEAGARRLAVLPTGGRTPLAAGLALAARVLAAERLRDPDRRPLLVVVTDGRATSGSAADSRPRPQAVAESPGAARGSARSRPAARVLAGPGRSAVVRGPRAARDLVPGPPGRDLAGPQRASGGRRAVRAAGHVWRGRGRHLWFSPQSGGTDWDAPRDLGGRVA